MNAGKAPANNGSRSLSAQDLASDRSTASAMRPFYPVRGGRGQGGREPDPRMAGLEGAAVRLAEGLWIGDGDVWVVGDGLDDLLEVRIAVPHRAVRPVLGRIRRGAV